MKSRFVLFMLKSVFETARQHLILHPERIVGNSLALDSSCLLVIREIGATARIGDYIVRTARNRACPAPPDRSLGALQR